MFRSLGRIIASAVLLVITGMMMAAAKYLPQLVFPAYRELSRSVLTAIASVTGAFPFAVWEVLLVVLVLLFIYSIVHTVLQKKRFLSWLSGIVLAASVLIFLFTGLWGLNHYAPDISEELNLQIREYSEEELTAATRYYMTEAANLAGQVRRDADGKMVCDDFEDWARQAGAAFAPLAETWPVFSGSTAPVKKAALTGRLMSYLGNTGVFVDFTAESTVNPDTFPASIPHTMCHEAAHRCTIAGEDEANFAAFLACDASGDPAFRYSGYYSAFVYCYNALYDANKSAATGLWTEGTELLRADCGAANDHYEQYEGKVQDVATKVNDTYLKTFSEESGVQSYGEAADYLIAWYLQNNA